MDCRIEVVRGVPGAVVHLAGRLGDAQVPDFLEACASAGRPLRVDLSELISADAAGIDALRRVREMGVILDGVPGYLRLKIESLVRDTRATGARHRFGWNVRRRSHRPPVGQRESP